MQGSAARRLEPAPWERVAEGEEYEALCRARLDHLVDVREPLVLVSQVQRSGSTLLGQLFDGHPECHAHPYEIRIGPRKRTYEWPELDLGAPDTWFESLYERKPAVHVAEGYRTSSTSTEYFPFLFLPRLQRQIFDACVTERTPRTEREVLDCYFTSYFNAWLDNQNLYTGPKKVVVGTTPRLAMNLDHVERYFAAYPEGTLISAVRKPAGWFHSAAGKYGYEDVDEAIAIWRRSAESTLAAADRWGDRVVVVVYEALVGETEATMRRIAERIGISMAESLVTPTFNGMPIRANSSFPVDRPGILDDRIQAYRESLDSDTLARIDELAGDLYERALESAAA
jgi:Sulfotransferase family